MKNENYSDDAGKNMVGCWRAEDDTPDTTDSRTASPNNQQHNNAPHNEHATGRLEQSFLIWQRKYRYRYCLIPYADEVRHEYGTILQSIPAHSQTVSSKRSCSNAP